MYWIYLILFILAVLVPDIIPSKTSIFSIDEEKLEELLIFSLGFTGFLIFRWKERQLNKNIEEKSKIQKEAHLISKNLTDSYSYIGETNRKLDVLKNISMKLLEIPAINSGKKMRFFDSIIESIYILGKSKKFIIRFIDTKNKNTVQEVKSRNRLRFKIENGRILENLLQKGINFTESNNFFIVISPQEIDNIIAAVIISKNNRQQKLDDPDIIKALASHSLFLFHCLKKSLKLD